MDALDPPGTDILTRSIRRFSGTYWRKLYLVSIIETRGTSIMLAVL